MRNIFTTVLLSAVTVASLTLAGLIGLLSATEPPAERVGVQELVEAQERIAELETQLVDVVRVAERAEVDAQWTACVYWLGGWSQGNGYLYTPAERAWACQKDGAFRDYKVLEYGTGKYE